MKLQLRAYLLLLMVLSACAPPAGTGAPVTSAASQPITPPTFTHLPTEQIQQTRTPQPTRTPNLTNTPRPLPSATPTFDVASVISRTPSPPEQCPKLTNVDLPDLSRNLENFEVTFSSKEILVLEYLKAGGSPSTLIVSLRQEWGKREVFERNEMIKDLTGDGVPEILITPSELFIFGCDNGEYKSLFSLGNDAAGINFIGNQLAGIQDMNLNGIPEVVVANFGCGGFGTGQCLDVYVYEWDGSRFTSLIPSKDYGNTASMHGGRLEAGLPGVEIKDIDGNGTKELILIGDVQSSWYLEYFSNFPWRNRNDIYMWNGHNFVYDRVEFSTPTYRYQAVQDGDRAMIYGKHEEALFFYQDAIFSDNLLGWSVAHREYYTSLHSYKWDPAYQSTPAPAVPPDDPKEYPHLAAYARYRIMLIHILLGNKTEAKIVYNTLQDKFPEGSDGHEFALMAKAFWDEYQVNSNVESACRKAIAQAKIHPDILNYLGGDYHNYYQDITYHPDFVCLFK